MKTAHETRHTLGLAMIMKDEVEDLDRIIKDYGRFFDKIYVTVTDKKTHTELLKKLTKNSTISKKVELSYFKWIDHFGKARIYNQNQVKTDYWMWMDMDDEIEGAESIAQVLDYIVTNDLDMAWFQYDYIPSVSSTESGSILWRARIIKTGPQVKWGDYAIHETIDAPSDTKQEALLQIMIKHRKTADQVRASQERDRLILEKDWQQTHRAETAWHIGASLKRMGDYVGAIEKFSFVVEHSEDWVLRFLAWQHLCTCYFQTGMYDKALAATNECIAIDPDHPGPWYQRFEIYIATGHHGAAMESAEIAMDKRIQGELAIQSHDPSWYLYKGPFAVAQTYLSIGNVERAYQLYREVKKIAPQYIEELSATTEVKWGDVFEQANDEFKNNPR